MYFSNWNFDRVLFCWSFPINRADPENTFPSLLTSSWLYGLTITWPVSGMWIRRGFCGAHSSWWSADDSLVEWALMIFCCCSSSESESESEISTQALTTATRCLKCKMQSKSTTCRNENCGKTERKWGADQPRPQGAFLWLWRWGALPPKPGKSALGTRLGCR